MFVINHALKTLMNLSKVQAVISRRFDRLNIHGIGFNDFMILYLLQQSTDAKMRRIDLAEQIGLTASGITRMLLPMEKIGLVAREANERDARVSYVVLTSAGKQLFEDAEKTASTLANEIIPALKPKDIKPLTELLTSLGGNIT
ncbi:MarR family winged helix-turn-helix transcriptional regulator [Pedobacter cryoconitis]|uniref:MarR family winged helix-turn-helix transcriptional regulator n=1 Tax=Pedobacter cryoconitis TaxID=188932 RepID=UPI001839B59A|nr:MarR family transcriptional regulator [Pedobacter cryoconitis]MBB5646155.1 DNA-binding MarR family transcriptional regulator [Pedobacter cryoconitis]